MENKNIFLKNSWSIVFKLLNDLLFILLVFFAFFIIADGILPGIISNYFEPYNLAVLLLVNILLLSFLGKKIGVNLTQAIGNKKTAFVLLFISLLLLFINLLRINIWLNIFIILLSITTGYYLYKLFSEE